MTPEIVRVKASTTNGMARVYHTDEDCSQWPETGWDKPLSELDDHMRECSHCQGEIGGHGKSDFSYQNAARRAE